MSPKPKLCVFPAHIRDPLNQTHPVKGWKLRFVELSALDPSKDVVNQLLSDVVSRTQGPTVETSAALSIESQMKASTPWFEAFRDCFIQMVKPSDHEFIRHFLGCLFVVSSNNSDPLNAFQSLSAALDNQKPSDAIHSKWFSNNIFKYYLMIHDITDGVQTKAEGIYQSMKSFYGSSICHMLMINSRNAEQYTPNLPDPWAQFIISTSKDTFAMANDEATGNKETIEDVDDELVVDENFDPLIAIQKTTPILIGPLSFDDEENHIIQDEHQGTVQTDGENRSSDGRVGGTCQFSGGLLSQSGSGGGQHGACLTLSDHDRIRIFIHELAIRGLLPFIEKAMRTLYDLIMARKGLHKSFFHATKKWFGGGKPAGQVEASYIPGIIYSSDSPELFWRKLGDLAFVVQNYDLAYNCYHTAKRDFNTNHAWLYFSGALEMASLSAFMVGSSQRQYPSHYMETSISTYIDTCRQHQFATRATLFSTAAFKSKGMYSEAAFAFLKMTGEQSDLLSAILLEQAAHCFLRTNPPRIRKYAFNMILAGHRYSKASQRKHALRCYKHSLINYHGRSWGMAEDHINFIIGRQSFNLRQLEEALAAFKQLLVGESLQSAEQEASYLREFLFVFQQLSNHKQQNSTETSHRLPVLPLPKLLGNTARVIFTYHAPTPTVHPHNALLTEQSFTSNPFDSIKSATSDNSQVAGLYSFDHLEGIDSEKWGQIELKTYTIVNQCQAPPNMTISVPCLTNETNNAVRPRSVMNETIGVEVVLENELKIPLTLSNLSLLWTFLPEDEDDNEEKYVGNEFEVDTKFVRTEVIKEFSISGDKKKPARLSVTPLRTGNLKITGIKFSLSSVTLSGPVDYIDTKSTTTVQHPAVSAVSLLGRLDINIRGRRLNSNKVERSSVVYGEDNRLNIMVVKPMPRLEVVFRGFPSSLLSGQLQAVQVSFSNQGKGPLHKLYVASTSANFFVFDGASEDCEDLVVPKDKNNSRACALRRVSKISLPKNLLNPGASADLTMWVQGRGQAGPCVEDLLFYYESAELSPSMSHRVVRHQTTIKTRKSLAVRATAKRSKESSNEEDENSEGNNQLVLVFEVENLSLPESAFRTFSVLQVSCVSRKWIMKPLSHQKHDGAITINRGETVMTHFKAVRRKKDSDLKISNASFVDDLIDISSPPYSEFFYRSNAWQELKQVDERSDTTMSVGLGLVALWESSYIDSQLSKHTVRGQSQVAVITLAESISAPIMKQPSKRPSLVPILGGDIACSGNTELYIKYTVRSSPGTITHNFEKERYCTIAVEVILHNCSQYSVTAFTEMLTNSLDSLHDDVTLRKDEKGLSKHAQQFQPASNSVGDARQYSTAFVWIGKKSRQVKMDAGKTVTLAFKANVFKSGVFNMHHCHVLASLASDNTTSPMVLQKRCPPCLVLVKNIAGSGEDSTSRLDEDWFGLLDHKR